MAEHLFELERGADRATLAALFEEFATGFADDRPVRVDGDGERVEIDPPERAFLEFEVEREDDEVATIAAEIELEWEESPAGPPSVRVRPDAAGKAERAAADEAQATLSDTADSTGSEADAPEAASDTEPAAEDGEGDEGAAEDGDGGDDGAADPARPGRRSRFEVYRDRADEWRWRLVHWNGNVVADGGEGYASRYNAERAVKSVMRNAPDATIDRGD